MSDYGNSTEELPTDVLTEIKALCIKWYGASELDPEIVRIALLAYRSGRDATPSRITGD